MSKIPFNLLLYFTGKVSVLGWEVKGERVYSEHPRQLTDYMGLVLLDQLSQSGSRCSLAEGPRMALVEKLHREMSMWFISLLIAANTLMPGCFFTVSQATSRHIAEPTLNTSRSPLFCYS